MCEKALEGVSMKQVQGLLMQREAYGMLRLGLAAMTGWLPLSFTGMGRTGDRHVSGSHHPPGIPSPLAQSPADGGDRPLSTSRETTFQLEKVGNMKSISIKKQKNPLR